MTRMLASVASEAEARLALAAGADIIDLKNPQAGALGALPLADIKSIVSVVAGVRSTSATVGDLPMQPSLLIEAVRQTADCGVDFVKIGFFAEGDIEACIEALTPLARNGIRLVAVLFADQTPDFGLLPQLQAAGFSGVMLDTCVKDGRNLLDHMPLTALQGFVKQADELQLYCGLAGSLQISHVAELSTLQPDYLGFRGALCLDARRTSVMSHDRVKAVCEMLQKYNNPSSVGSKAQTSRAYALHSN
jgi:uncharacterized protein (UPF0264 family)